MYDVFFTIINSVTSAEACSHVKVLYFNNENSEIGIAARSTALKKANFLLPELMQLNWLNFKCPYS